MKRYGGRAKPWGRRWVPGFVAGVLLHALLPSLAGAGALQEAIDAAAPGAILSLSAGTIRETVTIDKPLTIRGVPGRTVIAGTGKGTVVTIRASHVRLEDLVIEGSGRRRDALDAAIRMVGVSDVRIRGCRIRRSLFGIVAETSRRVRIERTRIGSYPETVVDNRGDAVRIWGSEGVAVVDNELRGVRDLAVTRSRNVRISGNRITEARYGVLLTMDRNVSVVGNRIRRTYAGIFVRGGRDLNLTGNRITATRLATGTGILLQHGRDIHVTANLLLGCAQAIYIDSSPVEIGMRRFIEGNSVVANATALHFHAAIRNNRIRDNDFVGNLDDVVVDIPNAKRGDNEIAYNYWSRYEGFDRDGDGVGDIPYRVLIYADKLWQYDHHLRFFYASPVLAFLDFIERIAPFDEPDLLLSDPLPRMERHRGIAASE
ncbi:nitrous oxide reductase family maturation protein NosD [Nitratifractor sp.]